MTRSSAPFRPDTTAPETLNGRKARVSLGLILQALDTHTGALKIVAHAGPRSGQEHKENEVALLRKQRKPHHSLKPSEFLLAWHASPLVFLRYSCTAEHRRSSALRLFVCAAPLQAQATGVELACLESLLFAALEAQVGASDDLAHAGPVSGQEQKENEAAPARKDPKLQESLKPSEFLLAWHISALVILNMLTFALRAQTNLVSCAYSLAAPHQMSVYTISRRVLYVPQDSTLQTW